MSTARIGSLWQRAAACYSAIVQQYLAHSTHKVGISWRWDQVGPVNYRTYPYVVATEAVGKYASVALLNVGILVGWPLIKRRIITCWQCRIQRELHVWGSIAYGYVEPISVWIWISGQAALYVDAAYEIVQIDAYGVVVTNRVVVTSAWDLLSNDVDLIVSGA